MILAGVLPTTSISCWGPKLREQSCLLYIQIVLVEERFLLYSWKDQS